MLRRAFLKAIGAVGAAVLAGRSRYSGPEFLRIPIYSLSPSLSPGDTIHVPRTGESMDVLDVNGPTLTVRRDSNGSPLTESEFNAFMEMGRHTSNTKKHLRISPNGMEWLDKMAKG